MKRRHHFDASKFVPIAAEFADRRLDLEQRVYREGAEAHDNPWPHDFDLPQEICDLPFLAEQAKRNILGLNAARIFNLDPTPVKKLIAS